MAALGLHCFLKLWRVGAPLLCGVRASMAVASLVAKHRLSVMQASAVAARGLSSHGTRAQPLRGTRNLPRPGTTPTSPALAGGLPSTAPGKSPGRFLVTPHSTSPAWDVSFNIAPCYKCIQSGVGKQRPYSRFIQSALAQQWVAMAP